MTKSKLIIHETDCHGSGNIHYQGKTDWYAYDDESGDIKGAVKALIKIGFIKEEDVMLFEGNEIYGYVESKLKEE